jgi:hypothetical protein
VARGGGSRSDLVEGTNQPYATFFLNYLLPYFVEVLVQDGVYFVKDFPDHPMSQYLKVSRSYVCCVLFRIKSIEDIDDNPNRSE